MTDWAIRIEQLKKSGKMVELEPGKWRLLSMGPTRDNHVLFESPSKHWNQISMHDSNFLLLLTNGDLYPKYPGVWGLKTK
jgi:hypothetical protein